jgi:myo-inositol-1(or 4)-monophosphatase
LRFSSFDRRHVDLIIETELEAHDVMALVLIMVVAGGIMMTWDNGPAQHGGRIVAAGDRRVHAEALRLLRGGLR